MPTPPCQCAVPGPCPRYRRPMEGRLFELCRTREDYRRLWDRQQGSPPPPADGEPAGPRFHTRVDDPTCGVVVGSYGWPRLVELQIRLIRDTCGPVPILISDDCSPGFGERVVPGSPYAQLQAVCARHEGVTLWPNVARIGHTGGDVAAFWKGLLWAEARGLRVLAKLSQRFLLDRPRWLHDGARELLMSGLPLATRRCRGVERFDLRTEACLLNVAHWHRPEILCALTPRRQGFALTAEALLHQILVNHCGGVFWPWDVYGEDRYERHPGVVWHCSDPPAAYRRLAERFGLALDANFHTSGWQADPSYVYG
jgi:hypothetical protein